MSNKVTIQDIENELVKVEYHILPGTTTTICALTGKTGWATTGVSACADPANFNKEVGEEWAYKDALNKWWPVMGFRLKDKLHAEGKTFLDRLRVEVAELEGRQSKLDTFVNGEVFGSLPQGDRMDLLEQNQLMIQLKAVLNRRLIKLEGE